MLCKEKKRFESQWQGNMHVLALQHPHTGLVPDGGVDPRQHPSNPLPPYRPEIRWEETSKASPLHWGWIIFTQTIAQFHFLTSCLCWSALRPVMPVLDYPSCWEGSLKAPNSWTSTHEFSSSQFWAKRAFQFYILILLWHICSWDFLLDLICKFNKNNLYLVLEIINENTDE